MGVSLGFSRNKPACLPATHPVSNGAKPVSSHRLKHTRMNLFKFIISPFWVSSIRTRAIQVVLEPGSSIKVTGCT